MGRFMMLLVLTGILPFFQTAVTAKEACDAGKDGMQILSGVLIDNKCARENEADLEAFAARHTKECALMPACRKSGYSLYAEGRLIRLDASGSKRAEKYLRSKTAGLAVLICGKEAEGVLTVRKICPPDAKECLPEAGKKPEKKGCCPAGG